MHQSGSRQPAPGQIPLGLADDAAAIRELLIDRLRAGGHRGPLVPEMGICLGDARVDLAAIGADLDGYEVKSPRDDLRRLMAQAGSYERVFDHMTLVAPMPAISEAARRLPGWWGLVAYRGGVSMEPVREPQRNELVDALATVRLLWRDEAAALLAARTGTVSRAARPVLWRMLVDQVPPAELRGAVRAVLRSRASWRSAG